MNGEKSCLIEQFGEFETGSGLFYRYASLPNVGDRVQGHRHNFPHDTIVLRGRAHVIGRYADGELAFEADVVPGEVFPIDAEIEHEFVVTEAPYAHYCAYASRLPSGKVAGRATGWAPQGY